MLWNIHFNFFRKKRFQVVDLQNATLSGGVAVGAIADLMIQPGGAFVMGSICGVVSTLGYRLFQVFLKYGAFPFNLYILVTILIVPYTTILADIIAHNITFQ